MAPCYQISSKYSGREKAFPLCHICSGISEQIGTCLCQFPISSYINQEVLKTSKLSHLGISDYICSPFLLYIALLVRDGEEESQHLREKETSNALEEKVTWGHKCQQRWLWSSARPGLAVGFYMCCLLLPLTPPPCPPQSSSLQKPWFQWTLLWEAKLIFFWSLQSFVSSQQRPPQTQHCQQHDLTHFSAPVSEKRWIGAFISAGLLQSEKGRLDFSCYWDLVIYLALCPALGHIYCLNEGGKAEILFFVLLPSDHLRNWALQHSRSLVLH